ncbi:hypothetical protein [Mycolicibacterium thermoresistibile]
MRADTEAIHHFGHAGSEQGSDLAAVAATVSSLPVTAAASVFGPVGARFLQALAAAANDQAAAVSALGHRVEAGSGSAHATARAYTAAEIRGRHRLTAPVAGLGG